MSSHFIAHSVRAGVCATALALAPVVCAQTAARSGDAIYRAACATCHAVDGKGNSIEQVGFDDVELPDFTDCKFSTPEPDPDWSATIHRGGRARAFSRRMPSFQDALSDEEIDRVIDYLREFCRDRAWPRGDLNLPRPLVTEKAFPENESVVTTTISHNAPSAVENRFVYEHRLGKRSQYEIAVPINFQQQTGGAWAQGIGDVAVAVKHAFLANLPSGTIASGGGEVTLPTGSHERGLGGGTAIVEGFGMVSQMLPHDGFLHAQGGFEAPFEDDDPKEAFFRLAAGKTFSYQRFGRAWSPMIEFVGARELVHGTSIEWDVVPQFQVSLSTRQHILFNAGVSIPVADPARRDKKFMMYFLWDWFDGGLLTGW